MVSKTLLRLLPFESLQGASNMAADEVMLHAADAGLASLRFYTWAEPTLSLGYFQAAAARLADPLLADIAWVRRSSGGGAILHHRELTYCLALPAGLPWQTKESWLCRMHHLIAATLQMFGVSVRSVICGEEQKLDPFLCFLHQTPGDLLLDNCKVAGSAQRRLRGAIMQHGSILLEQSPYTLRLRGIGELSGKRIDACDLAQQIVDAFAKETGWELTTDDFSANERLQIETLARDKYLSASWNEKR